MNEIYLDNSATTRVDDQVAQAALDAMCRTYGNPSSLHTKGLEAELMLDGARRQVAAALGAQPEEIAFTSGGTEANNLALLGAMAMGRRRGGRVVVTAFEHSSVLAACAQLEQQGCEVVYVKPDAQGHIAARDVVAAVDERTALVSAMLVNNEVGTVAPVEEIARALKLQKRGALLHCDAVQAFGKLPIRVARLGVDLLTVSGHKIYAPKGVGALYIKKGVRIAPRAHGGAQERGLRVGTEPAPAIAALGKAAELIDTQRTARNTALFAKTLREGLAGVAGLRFNSPEDALPSVVNLSAVGIRSEIMMHYLEQRGIYVSSGSACAKGERSHVLRSMGLPDEVIDSALRVSFGKYNTCEDIARFITVLRQGMKDIKRSRP
ncbi:cysteine desulfurase [Clostridiaceae bacterium NSJ-31]|uniref:cysteine desulfurase n=3 Tax=Ligaoa zhengdingensis TaxID=2763658 RepID=A0A926E181_9FIRM|nr:cysteine desulfurase family protein [Ligaoa zhengdingensis]MBC8547512.1 cysteine desulfurase [Ligaoa zhengdingensis]